MGHSSSRQKRKRRVGKAKSTTTTEVQMLNKILEKSFAKRGLVLSLVLMGAALGSIWLTDLRRDVFPDLSAPVFNVIVQNPAMGAEELETGVAIPMEAALAGLPDVRRIRSNSEFERILLTSGRPASAASIGIATPVSSSSAPIAGFWTITLKTGAERSGNTSRR